MGEKLDNAITRWRPDTHAATPASQRSGARRARASLGLPVTASKHGGDADAETTPERWARKRALTNARTDSYTQPGAWTHKTTTAGPSLRAARTHLGNRPAFPVVREKDGYRHRVLPLQAPQKSRASHAWAAETDLHGASQVDHMSLPCGVCRNKQPPVAQNWDDMSLESGESVARNRLVFGPRPTGYRRNS
ncbi:hypothetical protein OH77DRAFT_666784 [Trametes cingulata]|nr:hypothetical protein OH77DRAFT_666784 [Trametes cingulata]